MIISFILQIVNVIKKQNQRKKHVLLQTYPHCILGNTINVLHNVRFTTIRYYNIYRKRN